MTVITTKALGGGSGGFNCNDILVNQDGVVLTNQDGNVLLK